MNYNDSIKFEAQLQKQIAHTLRILYTGKNLDLSDSKLIIGILDKNIYNSLLISSFASDTLAYLINNDGLNFSNVELVNYIKDNWTIVKGQEEIRVFIDKNSIQSEQKAVHQHCGRGVAAPDGQGRVRQRQQGGQVPTVCLHCGRVRCSHDRQRPRGDGVPGGGPLRNSGL